MENGKRGWEGHLEDRKYPCKGMPLGGKPQSLPRRQYVRGPTGQKGMRINTIKGGITIFDEFIFQVGNVTMVSAEGEVSSPGYT